jgi:hypothetical protein
MSMTDWGPGWLEVLDAIAAAPWAWSPVTRLADRLAGLGLAPGPVLAALEAAGWVEPWDLPSEAEPVPAAVVVTGKRRRSRPPPAGLCLTLTGWAAQALKVEIVEQGANDRPRWGRTVAEDPEDFAWSPLPSWIDLPVPGPAVCQRVEMPFRLPYDTIPCPGPGPLEELLMVEERCPETGEPLKDPDTGKTVRTPVMLFGRTIPRAKRKGKGKKRRAG